MKTIAEIIGGAQALLDLDWELQDCFEEYLSDECKTFLHILRVVEGNMKLEERRYAGVGRKPYEYLPFVRSQLAKRVFNIEKTSKLIERLKSDTNLRLLCGFKKVPGKASFSRNFSSLSSTSIMEQLLENIVLEAFSDKIVFHVSRDSTAIAAREKVKKSKKKNAPKAPKKRGRPVGSVSKTIKTLTPVQKQILQEPEEALSELNKNAAWGCKENSQGNISYWKGYKLNLDVSDTGFPLTAVVTGANVHDSRLAIPMEKLTEKRVQFCYSLMDTAYDSKEIIAFIKERGRAPIIELHSCRKGTRLPLDPAERERFNIRTSVERANGYLKDHLLPKHIFVKGHAKVSFVLLSAVVCLAALRYLQMLI